MRYSIPEIYKIFLEHPICTDSRKVAQGQMFFALKGRNFDGNKYATYALSRGCSYAIVDDPKVSINERYILVDNALKTLQNLANHHRRILDIPILAITGSNGKTTTKELLKRVLSQRFKVFATIGNFNNNIGVPLTLSLIHI